MDAVREGHGIVDRWLLAVGCGWVVADIDVFGKNAGYERGGHCC
jgi:hypothetical protein